MASKEGASFDWCSFFALFWNDKGLRARINIPDTVLFRYGQLSAWWATNKEGYVQRHASHNTGMEAIRRRFCQVAECDDANYSRYVSIVRSGDGQPQLLRLQAFNQLTELLSDRIEAGHTNVSPEVETPQVLQAFIQPLNDIRYVTTYIGGGAANITCHTFQRKYSRRYVAQGSPLPPGASDSAAAADAAAAFHPQAQFDEETADPSTGQGAVDPTLKMEFRKLTSHLVKYIEKAHSLTLAGIVVEWIRDAYGKIYLLSVLRTEWATNGSGHGGGSLGAANLTEEPVEVEESLPPPPPPPALSSYDAYGAQAEPSSGYGPQGVSSAWTSPSPPPQGTNPSGSPIYAPPPAGVTLPSPNRTTLLMAGTSGLSRPTSAIAADVVRGPGVPGVGAGTTMSNLAGYPGGSRAAGLSVTVGNTWPSHQHESQLGSPTGLGGSARAAFAAGPPSPSGSTAGLNMSYRGAAPYGYSPAHSYSGVPAPGQSAAAASMQASVHSNRIQSARPAQSTPMAERNSANSGTPGSVGSTAGSSGGARPPRPGSSPVAFGRTANTSPLRNSALNPAPVPGVMTYVGERSPSPTHGNAYGNGMPPAALPIYTGSSTPGVSGGGAGSGGGGGGSTMRTASPARSRPATGGGTGHVNAGARGAPLMMQQMTRDLESARDQLMLQNHMAEASAAKVRQLEREKELMVLAFDQQTSDLRSSLLVARQDLSAARAEAEEQRKRADEAEARVTELEQRNHALQSTLDGERGTVMMALRECHQRDENIKARGEQLEEEVLRLTERLKEESTAVAALKRQLMQFSDIAERYATTLKEGDMEPGMQEVLDRVQKLFVGQTNPFGESYAVQKVLNHYHGDLRAVFLYYAQLENNFAAYWPPGLAFQQWMLFCKETETSDPRANSRVSGVSQPHKMLHPRDCEAIFRAYAKLDPNAINTSAPVLSYEGFLSAIIDAAFRVKRLDNPYLSEALREYILVYVSRASKMSPAGLRRGQMRDALEGTKTGPEPSPGGTIASKSVTKAKKKATIARDVRDRDHALASAVRTTTGIPSSGGSLAASRPGSALSRKASMLHGAIEQDLAVALGASGNRLHA